MKFCNAHYVFSCKNSSSSNLFDAVHRENPVKCHKCPRVDEHGNRAGAVALLNTIAQLAREKRLQRTRIMTPRHVSRPLWGPGTSRLRFRTTCNTPVHDYQERISIGDQSRNNRPFFIICMYTIPSPLSWNSSAYILDDLGLINISKNSIT